MSTKSSKRRHRRINTTEEEIEKKPSEEIVEISDDNKSTISSTDTEKPDKDTSLKELKDDKEDKKENGDDAPLKTKDIEPLENGQPSTEKPESTIPTPEPDKTNSEQPSENGTTNPDTQNPPEDSSDIEPLVLEESEDPELQFPSETGSETSEIEKSPVLNRCKTRRSQTRNLPTPKTPKALDYNLEDEKGPKELRTNVTRLQPTPEIIIEEVENENISVVSNDMSVESSFSEKTQDTDLTNASVFVNLSDTTRNLDLTINSAGDESTINASSFLDSTKDKSYGETLRCLTGRKTLRSNFSDNYKPRFYASNIDLTDSSKKYSPIKTGLKRKIENDLPGEQKKVKTDLSPGLFSYISSPFKPKVDRTEIPSSTPKLTSFKFVHQGSNQIDEIKKVGVEIEENKKGDTKKWCSIM